jgi:hypothetical protein
VLRIPESIPIDEIIGVADEIDRLEREVFAYCQSPGFTIDGLAQLSGDVARRWPRPRGGGPEAGVRRTI